MVVAQVLVERFEMGVGWTGGAHGRTRGCMASQAKRVWQVTVVTVVTALCILRNVHHVDNVDFWLTGLF